MLPNIKLRTALFGLKVCQMKQNEKSISIFLINVYQMVVTYSVTLNTINMALIKCTECGEMISDKATVCPHCGAPIEKMTKCEDCGAEYSADAEMCPNCGCPNSLKEAKEQSSEQRNTEQKTVGISEERKNVFSIFLSKIAKSSHRASSMRLGSFFLTSQMNNGRPSNTSHSKTLPCCLFFLYW